MNRIVINQPANSNTNNTTSELNSDPPFPSPFLHVIVSVEYSAGRMSLEQKPAKASTPESYYP
jgi:hypothetical protein